MRFKNVLEYEFFMKNDMRHEVHEHISKNVINIINCGFYH